MKNSRLIFIFIDCSDSEDSDKEIEQLQKKKGTSKNELASNEQSTGVDSTRPISPTVLLILQNKIKCKHCEGGLKIKKHVKRTWSLICENQQCPITRSPLKSMEYQMDISEDDIIKNRENILRNCGYQ